MVATEAAAAAAVALLLHRHLLASSVFGATMRLLGCSRQFLSAWSATLEEEQKEKIMVTLLGAPVGSSLP